MVSLEQIKLLESKISRAISFVNQMTEENARLKKRNEELEETVTALREETTKVEEGIVSALGKLNQFEDAIERSLSAVKTAPKPPDSASGSNTPAAERIQPAPVQSPVPSDSVLPSAYTVDEETEDEMEEEAEDSGEAELDIF